MDINRILEEQSVELSKLLSNPDFFINSERLEDYLRNFCLLLKANQLACKIILDCDRVKCLSCPRIYRQSSSPNELIFPCEQHSFCSKECAMNYINLHTANNLLKWQEEVFCFTCNVRINREFIDGIYGASNFAEILEKLEYDAELEIECSLCENKKKLRNFITLQCNHRFCRDCIKTKVESKINEPGITSLEIDCPLDKFPIDIYIIKDVISKEAFEIYNKLTIDFMQLSLNDDELQFKCPAVNCNYMAVVDRALEEVQCPKCLLKCCPKCRDIIHKGMPCNP